MKLPQKPKYDPRAAAKAKVPDYKNVPSRTNLIKTVNPFNQQRNVFAQGVFWVAQAHFGLWRGGAPGFAGIGTYGLGPCVGLFISDPGLKLVAHFDSQFLLNDVTVDMALLQIRAATLGVNAPTVRIYGNFDGGQSEEIVARLYSLFVHMNDCQCIDKANVAGAGVINFATGAIILGRDQDIPNTCDLTTRTASILPIHCYPLYQ